jgi:hypothetical protein
MVRREVPGGTAIVMPVRVKGPACGEMENRRGTPETRLVVCPAAAAARVKASTIARKLINLMASPPSSQRG